MSSLTERAYMAKTRREIELVQDDIEALFKGVPDAEIPKRYPEELGVSEMLDYMLQALPPEGTDVDMAT
jgi:hypothetical protein